MLPEFASLGVSLELLLLPRHPHLLAEPGRHLLQSVRHTRQTLQSGALYTGLSLAPRDMLAMEVTLKASYC